MTVQKTNSLFNEAKDIMPGGVSSPVRAFQSVGGSPVFIDHGKGAYLYDVDNREYIDYVLSWGPLILGHADPDVIRAVQEAASKGTSFGAPTVQETDLARLVREMVPSMEMIRFVNSGTEAAMSVIRVARGFTKRDKILKFDGCYHGHNDAFLVKAGSGSLTLGIPASLGVPKSFTENTISLPFNNLEAVSKTFEQYPDDIAALIVEPVCGNMGLVLPENGFLQGLREITEKNQALLIFDEVMSGFRVSLGGAQEYYKVIPDITCLGKVIGGGLPVGAYGGRKDIMECVAPLGAVYQAGTLSGNPLAMCAGITTLRKLRETDAFEKAKYACRVLAGGIEMHLKDLNLPWQISSIGTMFCLSFNQNPIRCYEDALRGDEEKFKTFFHHLLSNGVYIAPSQYEVGFTSSVHSASELDKTLSVILEGLKAVSS